MPHGELMCLGHAPRTVNRSRQCTLRCAPRQVPSALSQWTRIKTTGGWSVPDTATGFEPLGLPAAGTGRPGRHSTARFTRSAQAVFGWWRKVVEAERDWPRLIVCREGISGFKTTHQQGEHNCTGWRTPREQFRRTPSTEGASDYSWLCLRASGPSGMAAHANRPI